MHILKMSDCIVTASGIVILRKQSYIAPVESRFSSYNLKLDANTVISAKNLCISNACYLFVHKK